MYKGAFLFYAFASFSVASCLCVYVCLWTPVVWYKPINKNKIIKNDTAPFLVFKSRARNHVIVLTNSISWRWESNHIYYAVHRMWSDRSSSLQTLVNCSRQPGRFINDDLDVSRTLIEALISLNTPLKDGKSDSQAIKKRKTSLYHRIYCRVRKNLEKVIEL